MTLDNDKEVFVLQEPFNCLEICRSRTGLS